MAVVTNQKASFDANTNADLEVATRTKTGGAESGELLQRVIPSANDGSTLDVATEATLTALNAKVTAVNTGAVTVSSSALPTGAATSALQTTGNTHLNNIAGNTGQLVGPLVEDAVTTQKLAAIAAYDESTLDYHALRIDGGSLRVGGAVEVSSSALPTGAATETTLDNIRDTIIGTGASSQQIQGSVAVGGAIAGRNPVHIAFKDLAGNAVVPTGLDASGVIVMGVLPLDAALHLQDFSPTGEAYGLVAATANSSATARYLACDANGNLYGRPAAATTATRTQVADSATDVAILASNANRRGGFIFNDSSALLYLAYGTTAATSSNYSFRVYPNGYHQIAEGYTGEIRGIWATDPNDGGAKVTELT